jgi:hypothetical protein
VRELLSNLPRDVLFILRTNALVRSINSELGAPTGSRFRIFGSSAVKGLSIPDDITTPEQSYFLSEIRDYVQRLPDGGFVLQKRTKAEILGRPQVGFQSPHKPGDGQSCHVYPSAVVASDSTESLSTHAKW